MRSIFKKMVEAILCKPALAIIEALYVSLWNNNLNEQSDIG